MTSECGQHRRGLSGDDAFVVLRDTSPTGRLLEFGGWLLKGEGPIHRGRKNIKSLQ